MNTSRDQKLKTKIIWFNPIWTRCYTVRIIEGWGPVA